MSDNATHSLLGSGTGAKVRVADENILLRKSQGGERHYEWRSYVGASYAFTGWLSGALTAPWVYKSLAEEGEHTYTRGVGDAEAMARVRVWQNRPMLPSDVWRVSAGAALPTGNDWLRDSAHGDLVEEHSQLGSGAFAGLAGTDYVHYGDRWSWGASLFGRVPAANARGYRYGLSTLVTGTFTYELAHSVSLAVSPIYRFAAKDQTGAGLDLNSGGSVVYVEPAVLVARKPVSLRAKAAVPVATALFGEQREYPIYSLMFAADFL